MFTLQNLNFLLNNAPQMSVLAKCGTFPSSSLPSVKKLPELDALYCEFSQVVQLFKEIKKERFWNYFSSLKHEVGVKAFEWLHHEDSISKLMKRVNNSDLPNNWKEAAGSVTSFGISNNKTHANEKYNSQAFNSPKMASDLFDEFKLADALSIIGESKKSMSIIPHLISFRNISNQILLQNGSLFTNANGRLHCNVNTRQHQGQKRGFKTKRQFQGEIDRSFWGIFQRVIDILYDRKEYSSDTLRKEPQSNVNQPGEQPKNANPKNTSRFQNTNALLRAIANVLRMCFWATCFFLVSEIYRGAYSTDKFVLSHVPETINVTFDDAKGMDEAKAELKCVVEFLRDPSKFMYLGGKLPSGVLLHGPPGTGKTLLARAVAGEANVQFFHVSGSEFDEVLVGEGARRVRTLFNTARKKAPAVIFIDEIDAVGGKRVSTTLHPFANQTVIQLLAEMDGFVPNERIIVIGATNRESDLDEALLRPGRFDLKIQLFKPDIQGRREILKIHLNKVVHKDIDIEYIAKRTVGFSGADLENLINQAALAAATDSRDFITTEYMDRALEKIMLGPAMKSIVLSEQTKLTTAYHESGHATVAYFTPGAQHLLKATIIPHNHSLGHTTMMPSEKQAYTKSELLAIIDVKMGGRAGEELMFGSDKVTTGCEHDLEAATLVASQMVRVWGMSEKIGLRHLQRSSGCETEPREWGQTAGDEIDQEIKTILQESFERAKELLKKHAKEHKLLAEKLLEKESLTGDEIKEILGHRKDEDGGKNEN